MPPNEPTTDEAEVILTAWQRHRFFVLIAGVILISMFMVSVALNLYNSSGAAQVDLSRPGYQSIQKQASRDTTDDNFSSSGTLKVSDFELFKQYYSNHANRVVGVDSFDSQALSDGSLQLFSPDQATPSPN